MVELNPTDAVEATAEGDADRAEEAADQVGSSEPRRASRATATLGIGGLGAFLAIAYFPLLFDRFPRYDDEGFFLTSVQSFLKHGSLYSHTRSTYGPFYYSLVGLIYRLTGQQPTLFNGRLLVLGITALTGCVFAATVFRVTRSLAFSALCQVTSFLTLINVAGREPLHPGSLIVLLVAVLAYALTSYAVAKQTRLLALAGAMVGAIAMCKINVGVLAAVAVLMAWVIGNRQIVRPLRALVAIAVVALPFALMAQRLYDPKFAVFAAVVAVALLATVAALHADEVALPVRPIVTVLAAAAATVVISVIWPLLHGTSLGAFVKGVAITPLKQVDILSRAPDITLSWIPIVATIAGTFLALSHRDDDGTPTLLGSTALPPLLLAIAAAWLIGLGGATTFGAWLPAIALLIALAWASAAATTTRLVLRFLVPLAILQSVHAYPVAGSQLAWATAAMFVPCVIALSAGIERLPHWGRVSAAQRALGVASLCLVFTFIVGLWPIAVWRSYRQSTALAVRGTSLVRLPAPQAQELQRLTHVVKQQCDTFYSAPGFDSLYVFTGIDPPTGLLSNHPGVLTTSEQRDLVSQLTAQHDSGKRVCVVRDLTQIGLWLKSSYGNGPLGEALRPYQTIVGRAGSYTVSVATGG